MRSALWKRDASSRIFAKAVERLRLEAARERVESSPEPIELVAAQTGFGDPERMRRWWRSDASGERRGRGREDDTGS